MKILFTYFLGNGISILASKRKIKGGASSGATDSANSWYYHNTTW